MHRQQFTAYVLQAQVEEMKNSRELCEENHGRPTTDFWLETDNPEIVFCVEKPTESKCSELLKNCKDGVLSIESDPSKGQTKDQQGTNYGCCYLKDNKAR